MTAPRVRGPAGLTARLLAPGAALLAALPAAAEVRFGTPELPDDYAFPAAPSPLPVAGLQWLDLGCLLLALALGVWAVHYKRSRAWVAGLMLASLLYFGFFRQGCVCPVGAIQNVAEAAVWPERGLPLAVLLIFLLPLLVALYFGRVFCASVCPLGGVQDCVLAAPVRVPAWLEQALGLLPYAYLGVGALLAASGTAYLICEYDPFVGFFRLNGPSGRLLLGGALLLLGLFVGRPYCRFLCPYGALLRLLAPLARRRVSITPSRCLKDRLCEDACPFNAIRRPAEVPVAGVRSAARRRLGLLLLLLPVLAGFGAWSGGRAAAFLLPRDEAVQRAASYWRERGELDRFSPETEAFREQAVAEADIWEAAAQARARLLRVGWILGAFLGLVLGLKLVALARQPGRKDYEAAAGECLACARCYLACPVERARLAPAAPADLLSPDAAPGLPPPLPASWRESLRRAALAAGFCAAVAAALLWLNSGRESVSRLVSGDALAGPRERLAAAPGDEALKERFREADRAARSDFQKRQTRQERGAWLLLAACAVCLGAWKWARRGGQTPPDLRAPPPQAAASARGLRAVAVLAVIFCVGMLWAALAAPGPGFPWEKTIAAVESRPEEAVVEAPPGPGEWEANWPHFRGPSGVGLAAAGAAPEEWDGPSGKNILWKSPVPLPGLNSPILWGKRVFLSGATPERREVYAFDAETGALLWRREVNTPHSAVPRDFAIGEETGYAAPTLATDGRRVGALFANGDLAAFALDGQPLWQKNLGRPESTYGFASSLLASRDRLIVQYDQAPRVLEDGREEFRSVLLACAWATGRELWRAPRPVPDSWSTPILINAAGREEIVCCGSPWVCAYAPETGAELWRARCLSKDVAASPAFAAGLLFVANDWAEVAALRPGGSGEVTGTHKVWRAEEGLPDTVSLLADGERVYLVKDRRLTCYSAREGALLWSAELPGEHQASPILVGRQIYLLDTEGVMRRVAAASEFILLGEAALGEKCAATPAFTARRIFIRGEQNLYCIGAR